MALVQTTTAKDGTVLGFRVYPCLPPPPPPSPSPTSSSAPVSSSAPAGLVVVHGSASSGYNHAELAAALAASGACTVYVMDRRGRGLSGPFGGGDDADAPYGVASEVADLAAVLAATGAHAVFGVSSGALVCLEAARTLPPGTITQLAIYEPPLVVRGSLSTALVPQLERELAAGDTAAALITGMLAAQMGPSLFRYLPRWLLNRAGAMLLSHEDRNGTGEYVAMRQLAPTLLYDFRLVVEMAERAGTFATIAAPVLLLNGSRSPAYLKTATDELARTLPNARRVVFEGFDHGASWNKDRRGTPGPVAHEIAQFLVSTTTGGAAAAKA